MYNNMETDHEENNPTEHIVFSIDRTGICINTFLRNIKERNKDLVFGYVRNSHKYIPSDIISYIMLYIFLIIEQWDTLHKSIKYGGFAITQNKKEVIKYSATKWENVFDTTSISMNTGIHQWTIKLTAGLGIGRWVLFGLAPQRVVDNFVYRKNKKQRVQWIINSYFNGYALHLGNGIFFESDYAKMQCDDDEEESDDVAEGGVEYIPRNELHYEEDEAVFSMIFDSNQRTLRYVFNDKVFDIAMYNIKRQTYKMAVSFLCPCKIQFISYTNTV